ncbi:hypothetical protein D1007_54496 [Hordeum vulgare]|nr:hypothetical protein D1007_54496 [Hordeum vulgare]
MLLVTVTEPISNRLSFPCQIREQSMVPLAISDTSWQPELSRSLEHCASRPLGLEVDGLIEAGLFDNSDPGLLSAFDQSHEKCTSSSFLGLRNGILDDNSFSRISNFHVSESNGIVLNPDRSCLNSICSTSDYPFEQRSKSFSDSAARISCMTGMEENHLTEAELFDNPDTGLLQGLDRLPLKFTASSFSKYTSGDHHHDPKDSNRNLCMDANDTCLDSLSSYSEHSCKQNWESLCDFSTESWPSSHHAQSRGGSLEAMFGFSSNGSICNDFEDDNSMTLVEDNTKSGLFGTLDLALFGSCSTSDSISETPMLFLDSISVSDAILNNRWIRDIAGTLNVQDIVEFLHPVEIINSHSIYHGVEEIWASYAARSAYSALFALLHLRFGRLSFVEMQGTRLVGCGELLLMGRLSPMSWSD